MNKLTLEQANTVKGRADKIVGSSCLCYGQAVSQVLQEDYPEIFTEIFGSGLDTYYMSSSDCDETLYLILTEY